MKMTTPAESARTEDPKEQRLRPPRPVATSLKPTSCWPPRKASIAMEINIFHLSTVYCLLSNQYKKEVEKMNSQLQIVYKFLSSTEFK